MARVDKNKKPLRGSIRQNTSRDAAETGWFRWFGFWPRLALLVLSCLALIAGTGWLWRGQWPRQQRALVGEHLLNATRSLGFAVREVVVEGRNYTDKKSLLDALNVEQGMPIFAFDPYAAHERIDKLPWTKSATVFRSLPNRVVVMITEREPVARWQHTDRTIVVDSEGKELTEAKVERFPNLPLIRGDVAPEQTAELLSLLSRFPPISQRLKAAVRVAGRRWNIHLHPDITVRLPETGAEGAMIKLSDMIEAQKITDLDVKAVDLRLPEKIYIEPSSHAAPNESGEKTE